MQRGPFHAISAHQTSPQLSGEYVDVFQPDLPVLTDPEVPVGRVRLYRQVGSLMSGDSPRVLHANQELLGLSESPGETSFTARGPEGAPARVRLWAAGKTPGATSAGVQAIADDNGTVLLLFTPAADGKAISIGWAS